MANLSDAHALPTGAHLFAPPKLPAELLYIVVSHVVINYLDDVIAGPLALPSPSLETIERDMARFKAAPGPNGEVAAAGGDPDAEGVDTFDLYSDESLEKDNPIIALLQTGVQLRATALKVLSSLLGIRLSKEGLGRLEEKPWRSIQLTRYCWANPAYIYHFRRHFNFHVTTASSGLIMLYTKISLNRFRLQRARHSIEGMNDNNFLGIYHHAKHHTDGLAPDSWRLIALPGLIKDENAREKIQKRTDTLATEMAEFMIFKVYTPMWRCFYVTVCGLEKAYQLHPEKYQNVAVGQTISDSYQFLCGVLSATHGIINKLEILSHNPDDVAHIKEVNATREVLQTIIQYEGREDLDYMQCRNAAQKLCDWLDGLYGRQASAEGPTAESPL